jgi:hypothetical protein
MKIQSIARVHRPSRAGIAAAAIGVLLLVGLAAPASAQTLGKANIDFAFVAGQTQFPAGAYEFEASANKITLRSKDPKVPSAFLPVVTRLGRHDKDTESELVFDKVGDKLLLSEIWIGSEDGYLVLNTPGNHPHAVVGGSNPRK